MEGGIRESLSGGWLVRATVTARNPGVDAIIRAEGGWLGERIAKLRGSIHAAHPGITEAAKWKKPSSPLGVAVFERGGIVCVLIPLKGRVRLMFPDGSRLPDPKKLFNAQLNGKSRAIDFREADKLDAPAIRALVRGAVALRTGTPAKRAVRKGTRPPRS